MLHKIVHDVPDFIQKPFMIMLMLNKLAVFAFTHKSFLQRKMRRDGLEEVAEEGLDRGLSGMCRHFVMKLVDQIDQLAVLVINRLDADAVLVLPLQQGHGLSSAASVQ